MKTQNQTKQFGRIVGRISIYLSIYLSINPAV
jgi:hypothetical protein